MVWEQGRGLTSVVVLCVAVAVVVDVITTTNSRWHHYLFGLMANGLEGLGHGNCRGNLLKNVVLVVVVVLVAACTFRNRRSGRRSIVLVGRHTTLDEKPSTFGMNGLDDGIGNIFEYHEGLKSSRIR